MQTLGIILAVAFTLAGSSLAGSAEAGLPGPGTFSYNGSPVNSAMPRTLVADAR